jgi:hypothetical protein
MQNTRSSCSEKEASFAVTGVASSRSVNMDGIFLYAMAAGDQFYDAANIAADVIDPGRGESVLDIPADKLFLPQVDDLKIIHIVCLEVMLGPRGGAVQFILQGLRNFDAHEQSLTHLNHASLLLFYRGSQRLNNHAQKKLIRKCLLRAISPD